MKNVLVWILKISVGLASLAVVITVVIMVTRGEEWHLFLYNNASVEFFDARQLQNVDVRLHPGAQHFGPLDSLEACHNLAASMYPDMWDPTEGTHICGSGCTNTDDSEGIVCEQKIPGKYRGVSYEEPAEAIE